MKAIPLTNFVVDLASGSRPKGGVNGILDGVPSLGGEHIGRDGNCLLDSVKRVPREFFDAMPRGHISVGDILVVKDGATTGKVAIIRPGFPFRDASINEHVFQLRVAEDRLDPVYAFHYLFSANGQREILKDFRGATIGGISRAFTDRVLIPVPYCDDPSRSLVEQRRLATLLDKADAIRRKRQEGSSIASELPRSVFIEWFGDPLTNPRRFPHHEIGEHIKFMTSGSRGWAQHYSAKGPRFIRSLDVQMNRIGSHDTVFVRPPPGTEAERTRVQPDDVLLTITGSCVGRVAPVPHDIGEAYVSQHVSILRLDDRVRPRFISRFLSDPRGGQYLISRAQYGQTKPGLNLEQIRRFKFPYPPVPEQERFERVLDHIESLSKRAQASAVSTEELFNALVQRAFRGEL